MTDTTQTDAIRLLDNLDKNHDPDSGDHPTNPQIVAALADAGLLTTPLAPNRLTIVLDHFNTTDDDDYALHLDYNNTQHGLDITDYLWATIIAIAQHAAHANNLPEGLATITLLENLTDRTAARYTPNDDH